ncbi:MAG: 2Fe-2S iron-sulfur cluster binding domain-containing protein [SAR324 cluster bacterium]|nr:2Fe-2S iron-sulfur cluster binding domain-containing protein [SAR324 cluster bacterium]
MATVYFSSPSMAKNKKVTAIAGKREAILGLAENNGILLPRDCVEGECGSCIIEVTHLEGDRVKAIMLTDKERTVLKSMGKLSKKEEEQANVSDIPPKYRLACQAIVTDEDILVKFTGTPGVV